MTSQEVEVVILYDDEVELREAFSVIVTHDKNRVAKVKVSSHTILAIMISTTTAYLLLNYAYLPFSETNVNTVSTGLRLCKEGRD